MDSLKENLLVFLGTAYFWEWFVLSLSLITLGFLFRHKWMVLLQTGRLLAPGILIITALCLTLLGLRAAPTGDEPHYLILTQSILRDGNFDVHNNYEQRDYLEYYPDVISDPHVTIVGDIWYPVHGIGLPLLAAPFYAAGKRPGVVLMLALITVAGIRTLWSALRRAGFSPRPAGLAALVACFTLPVASLSGQIFPEVPAFLLVALALRSIVASAAAAPSPAATAPAAPAPAAPALTGWDLMALILSLVILPWLHPKYAALALALLLSALWIYRGQPGKRPLIIASGFLIASVAALAYLTYRWFGVPLPGASIMLARAPYEGNWLIPLVAHFLTQPWVGLAGVLFDQQSGIFIASPVYILAIPGALLLWQKNRSLAVLSLLVFASIYLPAGAFGVWYGGFSSPARLLAPAIPVLALGIASVLEAGGRMGSVLFAILAPISLLHAYLMITLPSFTRYGDPVTQHNYFIRIIERLMHLDLTPIFPTFRNVNLTTWSTTAIYLISIFAIGIYMAHRSGKIPLVRNAEGQQSP